MTGHERIAVAVVTALVLMTTVSVAGRAMHETTVAGKALATAFYGKAPRYAYMLECGGGSNAVGGTMNINSMR